VDIDTKRLVDDFVLEGDGHSLHVLNAVSPAFTCCLTFAKLVADRIPQYTNQARRRSRLQCIPTRNVTMARMSPRAVDFPLSLRLLAESAVLSLAALLASCRGTRPGRKPDVVFITIDTLRADHLGCYGYPRNTSPAIDEFAAMGRRFEHCYSNSSETRPSHAALFSGRYPQSNGVLSNEDLYTSPLPLLVSLRRSGYTTGGFVSSLVLDNTSGLGAAFDQFDDAFTSVEQNRHGQAIRPATATLARALIWYRTARAAGRPVFLWIHLIDPHGPYVAHHDPDRFVGDRYYNERRSLLPVATNDYAPGAIPTYQVLGGNRAPDYYVARYDAAIRAADDSLAGFFNALKSDGTFDPAFIVLVADHGETLDDPSHRMFFSHSVVAYREDIHVPLIVKEPKGLRRFASIPIDLRIDSIDIAPTLADELGIRPPEGAEGRDLLRFPARPTEPVFAFGEYGSRNIERIRGTQFGILRGTLHYLLNTRDRTAELYDWATDPMEHLNIAAEHPGVVTEFQTALRRFFVQHHLGTHRSPEITSDRMKQLRSLGYIN